MLQVNNILRLLMRKFLSITILFFLGLTLWGCATPAPVPVPTPAPPPSKFVFAHTLKESMRSNYFGAGETPCVTVDGYGCETITYHLVAINTGKIISRATGYVPKGDVIRWCFPDILNGSYKVDFLQRGRIVETVNFDVSWEGAILGSNTRK